MNMTNCETFQVAVALSKLRSELTRLSWRRARYVSEDAYGFKAAIIPVHSSTSLLSHALH